MDTKRSKGKRIPEPNADLLARTLLHSLGVDPNKKIFCEHGCAHSAKEFVEGHLLQLIRQAQISVANTIGVEVEGL